MLGEEPKQPRMTGVGLTWLLGGKGIGVFKTDRETLSGGGKEGIMYGLGVCYEVESAPCDEQI